MWRAAIVQWTIKEVYYRAKFSLKVSLIAVTWNLTDAQFAEVNATPIV